MHCPLRQAAWWASHCTGTDTGNRCCGEGVTGGLGVVGHASPGGSSDVATRGGAVGPSSSGEGGTRGWHLIPVPAGPSRSPCPCELLPQSPLLVPHEPCGAPARPHTQPLTTVRLVGHVLAVGPAVAAVLQGHALIMAAAGELGLRADSRVLGHWGSGWRESEGRWGLGEAWGCPGTGSWAPVLARAKSLDSGRCSQGRAHADIEVAAHTGLGGM